MSFLRYQTSPQWVETVLSDLDTFLQDHAAAEKKASGMAVSMISHYPDKPDVVHAMSNLAIEEMSHFREVIKVIYARGGQLGVDRKDPYILALHKLMRKGTEEYFLDRLLLASIIEARGAERFQLIADALSDEKLKRFYQSIAKSEHKHYELFLDLAALYFSSEQIQIRLNELLDEEAEICANLPLVAALH